MKTRPTWHLVLFLLILGVGGCSSFVAEDVSLAPVKLQTVDWRGARAEVAVHYPKHGSTTEKSEIAVVAQVDVREPLKTGEILLNGKVLKRLELGSAGLGTRVPVESTAALTQGANTITIRVEAAAGHTVEADVRVTRIEPEFVISTEAPLKKWAVVIGISEYLHSGRGIPALKFAHRDARSFAQFLRSPKGGGFEAARVKVLINKEATTVNVRSALFTFLQQARKNDLVIVYFAGHGAPEPGRPDNLYLLTYDADPDDFASTAFPMWDMETALKRYIVADRVVVIADACHSGGVGTGEGLRSAGGGNLINAYMAKLHETKPGRAIITASEANELSREGREWGEHGDFTYYLLEGLRGQADSDKNGVVSIVEAFSYVQSRVRRATHSGQHPSIQGRFDPNLPLGVHVVKDE